MCEKRLTGNDITPAMRNNQARRLIFIDKSVSQSVNQEPGSVFKRRNDIQMMPCHAGEIIVSLHGFPDVKFQNRSTTIVPVREESHRVRTLEVFHSGSFPEYASVGAPFSKHFSVRKERIKNEALAEEVSETRSGRCRESLRHRRRRDDRSPKPDENGGEIALVPNGNDD